MSRFDWVAGSARLLQQTGDEFDRTRPFDGLRIGTGIHLEPKTAALLLTLRRGGADVVSTGNLNSTQQETVDYLRERGVDVIGGPTADPAEHDRFLRGVLATKPDLILDNGGDLFTRYLEDPWPGLRGGTEETTSGRDRLLPLRDRLEVPLLVINDSPISFTCNIASRSDILVSTLFCAARGAFRSSPRMRATSGSGLWRRIGWRR